jgi:ABC-type dipeptide/oligopeptide/nickel transport system permease subunit
MSDPIATSSATPATGAEFATASRTLWADAFYSLRRRPSVIAASVVVVFLSVVAAFPTLFTSTNPKTCDISNSKIRPQWFDGPHPLGTDLFGCDIYAQAVHGARPSLLLALLVVATAVTLGIVLGGIAGYFGGVVDSGISRVIDVFLVVPYLLAALLVLAMFRSVDLGTSLFAVLLPPYIVITAFAWMKYARYVRASSLEAKNFDYVTAARALGASHTRLLLRHVLPNAIPPVTALIPTAFAAVISAEAVLSFLGIGIRKPNISWGIMIADGAEWFASGYPHLLLPPLICLIAAVLAFVFIGDALRDALDPKLR